MQLIESTAHQLSTASIFNPETKYTVEQPEIFYDTPRRLVVGKGSLAISPDVAALQKRMMDHAIRLLSDQVSEILVDASMFVGLFPMHLDKTGFEKTIGLQTLVEVQEKAQLATRLQVAYEAEPLEDGMDHPAEQIIGQALDSGENKYILGSLKALSLDVTHPNLAASVLRCLGRQTYPGTSLWRTALVRDALTMDNIEIRDAAVQAAESWGDENMRTILELHSEPEPWLRDYISDVIDDLGD